MVVTIIKPANTVPRTRESRPRWPPPSSSFLAHMNIRQRITLLVLLSLVALAGTGIYAVIQSTSAAREVKLVTEGVVPSASKSVALLGQLKDVHLAAGAILDAQDPAAVAEATRVVNLRKTDVEAALAEQLAKADSTAQKGLVQIAQEGLASYFESIDEVGRLKAQGQHELAAATLAATATQYLREQGEMLNTLQVEKNRSKDEAINTLNRGLDDTRATLSIASVLALVALGGLGALLYRQIIGPLSRMERKMTEIATSQDFSQRLTITRRDEVGRSMEAFNTMIARIQEGAELVAQRNADIRAMLQAIPEGILTIDGAGTIQGEYSPFALELLEQEELAGQSVHALLFERSPLAADARSQIEAAIAAIVGEDEMNFEFNAHLLPRSLERVHPTAGRSQQLELHWAPMPDTHGVVQRLLLCARDVTEMKALAKAAEAGQRELALIGELLAVPQEKFQSFADSAGLLVSGSLEVLSRTTGGSPQAHDQAVAELFRNMHTIKGNARQLGLSRIAARAHDAEEAFDRIRKGLAPWAPSALGDELKRVSDELGQHVHVNENKLGRRGPGRRGDPEKFHLVPREQVERMLATLRSADRNGDVLQNTLLQQLRADLEMLGTERLEHSLEPLLTGLPDVARGLGKPAPVVTIDGAGIRVRQQASGVLRNIFVHLLRNAIDHGIEAADARVQAGKALSGRIQISAAVDEAGLVLRMQDDGRGLALAAIREKAQARGLIPAGVVPSATDLAELIFDSGFSTAEAVTDVSGRGVGMDAVRAFAKAEGGSVRLEFLEPPEGRAFAAFRVVIRLPKAALPAGMALTSETSRA